MSHNTVDIVDIVDIVVIVDVLHDDLWLQLLLLLRFFLVYSEFLSCCFCGLKGVSEDPGVRFPPPPYAAVRQDPVGLFVAEKCRSGDDDCDYDHETNATSEHA